MKKIYTTFFSLGIYLLLQFHSIKTVAQEEVYTKDNCKNRSGFEYGGVAGFYKASNRTAEFYSGKPGTENSVDYIFENQYWYDEIDKMLELNGNTYILGYPDKMSYAPAFSFGLFVKYDMNCHTGIFLLFSYAKLRANSMITIEVPPPPNVLQLPVIHLCPITGIEERNMVDLGISHAIGLNKIARLNLSAGINLNNTLVKESALYVEDKYGKEKKYNLVRVYGNKPYVPGSNQQAYDLRQGGIGFGVFGNVGVRMEFSPVVAIEPGLTIYMKRISLIENAIFYPQYNAYLKLIFRDLLNFNY